MLKAKHNEAMARPQAILFAAALLILATSVAGEDCCGHCTGGCDQCRDQSCRDPTYTYFLFSQQWPVTYCLKNRADTDCCIERLDPENKGFTLHGLWPEKTARCWPSCCSRAPFNKQELALLVDSLKEYWPSLKCNGDSYDFYEHEWEKHGTCSLDALPTVKAYFGTGLELRKKWDLANYLATANIVPDDTQMYIGDDIINALQQGLGVRPAIDCSHGMLNEVHVCLNKDLEPIDCQGSLVHGCPRAGILIPTPEGAKDMNTSLQENGSTFTA